MDHIGSGRQGSARSKEGSGGDNRLDSQIEGKEASYRGAHTNRESRWDEPNSPKQGWHRNNDERTTPVPRFRTQDRAEMPEDASDGGRRKDFSNRRAESNSEDVESWDRSGAKRQDFRDEEDKMLDRHRSSKDREDMAEGRARLGSKVQGDDWEEPDDRRTGWKSAKMGRGVKRSWSPNQKWREKVDYDEFEKDWPDDRREERGTRRDFDRDGEGHQDRKVDFPWDGDRDFQNRENFHEQGNIFRDRTRQREDSERWKHQQNDWHKEKEDDLDYNYERDGWEVPRRDKGKAERDAKSGENRREKDQIDVLKSPQSMLSDTMERAGAVSGDRGLGHESPFMSRRGEGGEFYGNNRDANWMADERSRHGESDYQDRPFLDEEGPLGIDHGFSRSSSRSSVSVMHMNVHNGRGRGPKGSPGQRGRASAGGGDGRPPFSSAKGMQQTGKSGRARGGGGGGKTARVGAREAQRGGGIPPPVLGPPGIGPGPGMVPHFGGHMGPPGSIAVMGSNMGPGSVPGMGPGGFPLPHFGGPAGWGAGRAAGDMGMHPGPPGPPVHAPGLIPPRFGPNMGPGHGQNIFYPPAGSGRGSSNAIMPAPSVRLEKASINNRIPPRVNAPAGMAPSRGEQNDYSQHFVDSGMRPQNFIRDVDLNDRFEEYPKLKELITRKDKLVTENACPPMYMQMDLRTTDVSPEVFGTKFDVILVDPPWEEYVRRAPGVGDSMEWWTFEEIQNLRIEAIADTPSFIFLWVGDAEGLDQGRLCLKKWGFRRCEDICWVKTNKENPSPALRHDASTLLQHSKEHCLMGIRGTVRRSSDAHIIHANIDTDIIISEEPPYGSTAKPEELYHIVEHFALGQRRLELFGEDHNIRAGWVTVGKNLTSSNFNAQTYCRYMGDSEGKVWQGGRGNPPVDAAHLVGTTPEIEALRPKSPPPRAQQQPSASQPSAALSNSKKAPNTSSQGVSPQNVPVSNSGPPVQVENSSSVIVINTSPSHGPDNHHHSQGPSTTKGGNPKHTRRSPLHFGPGGPLLLAGPEDEKAMVGDGGS